MIKQETVFILGAGASYPYGYPTGIGLTKLIREKGIDVIKNIEIYNNSKSQRKLYSMWTYDLVTYLNEHANPDDLIDWTIKKFEKSNPYLANIGKMLIIHFILTYEKENVNDKGQLVCKDNRDWYQELFSIMTKTNDYNPSPDIFKRNRVMFLTFNYDRSLDFFLKTQISNY